MRTRQQLRIPESGTRILGAEEGVETDLRSTRERHGILKRKRTHLIKRLGERAFQLLQGRESLNSDDPVIASVMDELLAVERQLTRLEDRINSIQLKNSISGDALPPEPGTDSKFPFSR